MFDLQIDYCEEMKPILPIHDKNNNISICLCTSNKYAPYCGITIQSIIENSSAENFYDIFIMEYDVKDTNKKLILSLIKNITNFSIRFINMKQAIKLVKVSTWAHFSVVACFKLFLMSDVFLNYQKMLVLDTDLIFKKDVAELFNTNLSQHIMAAVDDVIMKLHVSNDRLTSGFAPMMPISQYISEYLGFGSCSKYYNTGVAILNLEKCRENAFFTKAFLKLKSKGYTYQEQDVLNELCVGNILDLDMRWNVIGTEQVALIREGLSDNLLAQYDLALLDPYIIHFAGGCKPWTHNDIPYSEEFFKYARNTPWYEKILVNMSINYNNYIQNAIYATIRHENSFRFKFKKLVGFIFPLGSVPRKFIKTIFPRGSFLREIFRKTYNTIVEGNIRLQYKNYIQKIKFADRQSKYVSNLKKKVKKKFVLLDSKNGTDLAGNIFRIIEELNNLEYKQYKIFLTYQKNYKARIESILNRYNLKNVHLVMWESKKYFYLLARSKYLATDLYMPSQYIKRIDQILISTAHGTPLKVMGRDCHTETQGHLQRTHIFADYQTFPSDYMKEKLFHGFMENELFIGHALKSGYGRNSIFFDQIRRMIVRQELEFEDKIIYAYLPTFRGIAGSVASNQQIKVVTQFCKELDSMMSDKQLLLIKMHNFNTEEIDCSQFKHIQKFPSDYEVYDVLNATDVLISDYSSVFFDYANLRNKIILFQYDLQDYMDERGVYLFWNDLPFPIVNNVKDLFHEMSMPKQYDDTEFLKTYCTFDNPLATQNICRSIFKQEACCPEFPSIQTKKKNIFIYAGDFDLKTSSTYLIQEYLQRLDLEKNNYFIYFYEYDLFSKAYKLEDLPSKVQYISFLSYPDYTLFEKIRLRILPKIFKDKILQQVYKRECQKCFGNLPIDLFIDLFGENQTVAEIVANLPCKKAIIKPDNAGDLQISYNKYEVVLSYSEESKNDHTQQVIKLRPGYASKILDANAILIERLCNE